MMVMVMTMMRMMRKAGVTANEEKAAVRCGKVTRRMGLMMMTMMTTMMMKKAKTKSER